MNIKLFPEPLISSIIYPTIPPKNGMVLSRGIMRSLTKNQINALVKLADKICKFEIIENLEMSAVVKFHGDIIWLVVYKVKLNHIKTLIFSSEF